jgi:hypothetical protein
MIDNLADKIFTDIVMRVTNIQENEIKFPKKKALILFIKLNHSLINIYLYYSSIIHLIFVIKLIYFKW